jgi:hypothetical protein
MTMEGTMGAARSQLPAVLVSLLRGIVYRDQSAEHWRDLLGLQAQVRDYLRVLGLEPIIDEAEGYAFLRQIDGEQVHDDGTAETMAGQLLPTLIARRPLSYMASLLLVQLRKRLAQHDAQGGDTRLVLSREQIVGMMRTFLPGSTNDAKLSDQIERQITRVEELGFLRKMKEDGDQYEVRRILRAFVNADWLAELEALYRTHAEQLE